MILLNLKVTRFSLKENPARVLPNTCRVIIKVNLNYVDITISKQMNLQKTALIFSSRRVHFIIITTVP